MEFLDFVNGEITESKTAHKKTPKEYFAEVDPTTGLRYLIPMLNAKDPHYFQKYVKYMVLKEKNPQEFKRIMEWN